MPLSAAAAAAAAARSAATAANSLQEPANQGSSSSGGGSSAVGVPAGASTEEVAESLQREKAALLEELHAVSLAQQRQAAAPRRGASSDATSVRCLLSGFSYIFFFFSNIRALPNVRMFRCFRTLTECESTNLSPPPPVYILL